MKTPERIWVDTGMQPWRVWIIEIDAIPSYIRADLHAAALDRIAELEAVLSPFAKAGELFSGEPGSVEFDQCIYAPAAGAEYNLCGDDLRRARAVLSGKGGAA